MTPQTRRALDVCADFFRQLSRIGRWGTCGECPRDHQGNVYPEFCKNTDRYDHHFTAETLAAKWNIYNQPDDK